MLLSATAAALAWHAIIASRPPVVPRCAAVAARIKNAASAEAAEWNANPSLKPPRKSIKTDQERLDLQSPVETFAAICRMCGTDASERTATVDFDGFVLAFEQLYNRGIPLDPEALDELRTAVGSAEDEEVSVSDWNQFHRAWLQASTMEAHLSAAVAKKQVVAAHEEEKRTAAAEADQREQEWAQALAKAKMEAKEKAQATPTLLADELAEKRKKTGKWFEERESAARAAAQYRSLDPAQWAGVVESVGGLNEALEEIRRRVWTPLCAPRALLDELGAERVKGLLLYGPPGCGKSYLAARLASGLSRRPPTVISGPEIMDKYVGNSEAQLRQIFTSPPRVPHRPGDAEDVMMVAEENELHVIVLDEFDAIARQRSDGKDTATRDSVVNQLLVLMDGVAQLPVPTFVIALTNRRELVDSAILRPGRLEVQVEVGKPDLAGREAILRIHAEKMRDSGRLALDDDGPAHGEEEGPDAEAYEAWLSRIASQTGGFSGAAIAAVVRAAVARALDRSVAAAEVQGCRVSADDFATAIRDVRASSLELETLEAEVVAAASRQPGAAS